MDKYKRELFEVIKKLSDDDFDLIYTLAFRLYNSSNQEEDAFTQAYDREVKKINESPFYGNKEIEVDDTLDARADSNNSEEEKSSDKSMGIEDDVISENKEELEKFLGEEYLERLMMWKAD
ncbi:MAG: hypothetical protein ACTHWZ_05230 [Peptoniphilaceae bacterium]